MQNKSGRVFDDLSYDIKKKGLALLIKDLEGLEVNIRYLLNSYISKTTNILKSVIEQKLLGIMLSAESNFHFFAKQPHKGVTGLAPKTFFLKYLNNILFQLCPPKTYFNNHLLLSPLVLMSLLISNVICFRPLLFFPRYSPPHPSGNK